MKICNILSNYFDHSTSRITTFRDSFKLLQKQNTRDRWDFFNCFKNITRKIKGFRDSFKLLQKQDKGCSGFFQTISKAKHKGSPRLFQITYFRNKIHRESPRSFKLLQNKTQWVPEITSKCFKNKIHRG